MQRSSLRLPRHLVGIGASCLGAIAGLAPAALAGWIYPSFDPTYYQCQANLQPFTPYHLYVSAGLFLGDEAALQGITGAEFRIEGIGAPGWFLQIEPLPGQTIDGDPFGTGCRVSFPECRAWANDCSVQLLSVFALALAPVAPTTITVRGRDDSCFDSADRPSLMLCEAPIPTHYCVGRGGLCVNDASFCFWCPVAKSGCIVGVGPSTWTGVKSRYRDPAR